MQFNEEDLMKDFALVGRLFNLSRTMACVGGLIFLAIRPASAQRVAHPLDPLNFQEYWAALEVLRKTEHLDEETRFSVVNLKEPPKDLVWKWSKGQAFSREAFAIVRQGPLAYEALIDLNELRLASWTQLKESQPNWLEEELKAMSKEVKKDPRFIEAMKRRGISTFTFVDCGAIPPGYFGTPEQQGKRIAHLYCRDVRSVRNAWPREFQGLVVVVDVNEKKVLRVVDEGVTPIADTKADYDPESVGPPRAVPSPMRVDQPLGPGYKLDGNVIEWQKWRFHVRADQRVGTIVSTVTYDDNGHARPVLYQGHLSEIFVPYMDPSFSWYSRNFLDAGEFNAGGLIKPLVPGRDCPDHASYFDSLIAEDNGRPKARPKVICVFEREAGDMAWRHHSDEPESRRKRDLVVRSAAVLGNYDYLFDWVFQQDGSIRVAVGATGIAEVKNVLQATAHPQSLSSGGGNGFPDIPADRYGRFVDKHIVAVNHDHYFNFRLDLDVDGPLNTFAMDRLVSKTLPKDHVRRSLWIREPFVARTESEAKLNIDHHQQAGLWRVLSTTRTNHVGYPTSYQLMPGMNMPTLLTEDDYPRRRAGFINYHLWVTPYKPEERFAAGDYPTLSPPGQGLPAWTAKNRTIENTDVVLWHTIGMHHLVRAEDWPVMPVLWHSFELRPFDFFDRNPALDLPSR
jgi:primary-amine oxidase